jgi:hypothetical protein
MNDHWSFSESLMKLLKSHESGVEVAKMAPPAAVTGLSIAGVSLSDWLLLLTLVYTVLNLFFLLRDKWWRQRGKRK